MKNSLIKKEILLFLSNNLRYLGKDRFNNSNEKLKRFLIKNNLYELLQKSLNKSIFTPSELYNYLISDRSNHKKCNHEKQFLNFKKGYRKECNFCINDLKTKKEIYNYLLTNMAKYAIKLKPEYIKKYPIFKKINYDYDNKEDLYVYLNELEKNDIKCKLNSCNNKSKFKNFRRGYNDFCSIECNNKWLSESRMGKNNPVHRMTAETRKEMARKNSENMKRLIKEGKFTPCVTNSWCHSRYKIIFNRNGKTIEQLVRSSWEAFFQILNPSFLYEKLRVPYFYNDGWHTYIVDFVDNFNKEVIEIKPIKESLKTKNIIKENALIKWCKNNNFKYIKIDENYFKKLKWDFSIIEGQPEKNRLEKFKKYFDEN